jgi:hypothetical protein
MKHLRNPLLLTIAAIAVLLGFIIVGSWLADQINHPRYHGIGRGMTREQVDGLVGAGHDDYPNRSGGG